MAQQEKPPSAIASGQVCVGCGTLAAGRAMQQCPLCRFWSCSAPCSGAAAGPVASGGRSKRQGAGRRWSCPNPECAAAAAPATELSSDPTLPQPQPQLQQPPVTAAVHDEPAHSSEGRLTQQLSLDPGRAPAPAAMFSPGQGGSSVYAAGQHTDPFLPQINPVPTAGPPAYPPHMQSGMVQPYHLLQPGSGWPWGMPAAYPMMVPAPPPASMPGYPPAWQMPGMMMPPPFMGPWAWAGYPPAGWPGMAAYPSSMPAQPTGAPAQAAAAGGAGQRMPSRLRQQKRKKQPQPVLQEAAHLSDEDAAAASDSDDDWLTEHNPPTADGRPTQVARVVYKVGALQQPGPGACRTCRVTR
jgi:hypothetical protein